MTRRTRSRPRAAGPPPVPPELAGRPDPRDDTAAWAAWLFGPDIDQAAYDEWKRLYTAWARGEIP